MGEDEARRTTTEADEISAALGGRVASALADEGYATWEEINAATDEQLRNVKGVGTLSLRTIRERADFAAKKRRQSGVSPESATGSEEVKPTIAEAEAAGVGFAEPPPAAEVPPAPRGAASGVYVVRSLWPAHLKISAPTGAVYVWPRSGAEVNVAAQDLEFVLGKNRNTGRACCGASGERTYFQLA